MGWSSAVRFAIRESHLGTGSLAGAGPVLQVLHSPQRPLFRDGQVCHLACPSPWQERAGAGLLAPGSPGRTGGVSLVMS